MSGPNLPQRRISNSSPTIPITVYDSKGKATTVDVGPELGCFSAETAMIEEEFKRTSTSEIYTRAHVIAKEKAAGKGPLLGLPKEPLRPSTEEELRDFRRQDFKYIKAILRGTNGPKIVRTSSLEDDTEVNIKAGAPWGFAVYRTAYGPGTEEPWRRILDDIQKSAERDLSPEYCKEPEIIAPHYDLKVFDDEKRFSGADLPALRQSFREWALSDVRSWLETPQQEKGLQQIIDDRTTGQGSLFQQPFYSAWCYLPVRWLYFLVVDEACMRALDHPESLRAVVKLVENLWCPLDDEEVKEIETNDDYTDDWTDDVEWDGGQTQWCHENVGWRWIPAKNHINWYNELSDPIDLVWNEKYERPQKSDNPYADLEYI